MKINQLDISPQNNVDEICRRILSGVILFVCIAVPCSSSSILRVRNGTTSRSKQDPWGRECFAGEKLRGTLLRHALIIICFCKASHVLWLLENPVTSRLSEFPQVQTLMLDTRNTTARADQCMFGLCDPVSKLAYQKRILFFSGNLPN